ncbi:Gfo/Idh/MocA family protein [Geodermatophilus sabuli]|uniref:Predicted dehydrogenase n=1 Tax=Geodermatophilus sabuli TaxID=1564158 RepID=A0A285EN22_9ACTN|nr:Gfo/Idh/MocA family oxidoreductase [Geodermatophilus sabuli]MBB3087043.1 putative dehydrogenase [Geodermatophilus sabuli]SNX99381.1 Predicted dehydrogenase [Geodermatophilus sabuli]
MSRLRVGVVGTGFIAGRHLAALSRFDDVEVVAVADPVRERAEVAAARVGARCLDDGAALLQLEELDAVWLCVPPFAHGPLEAAAVARRLPFFVEKPLALDVDTAREVARQVAGAGLTTAVGYHWRHLDVVQRAAALLPAGDVRLVTGTWLDATPRPPWWVRRDGSGGQVVEQTTHVFDLARLLAGEVVSVCAAERPAPVEGEVATAAAAVLTFASGAVGSVCSTRVLGWRHAVGLQVVADGRVVELSERSLDDHRLRVVTADGEEVHRTDADPIAAEDREFVDVLCGRAERVRVPYAEALRTHALACAADTAARGGAPVRVES